MPGFFLNWWHVGQVSYRRFVLSFDSSPTLRAVDSTAWVKGR